MLLHLKLDDSSGQIAIDASGQGLDAVLLGGFDFDTSGVAGIREAALAFDGVGDAIDVGPVDFGHLSALTVAA